MENKKIKDLMIPCHAYPTVNQNASLLDAIETLELFQKKLTKGMQPFKAVLVVNDENKIIGKVGHLAFLKALEPKYADMQDFDKLSKANLSDEFISSIMENFQFWGDSLVDICKRVTLVKVKDIMHPVTERIDYNATLIEAMHKIIMWESLSILVSNGSEIVGLIRISDIFNEMTQYIKNSCKI